MVIAERRARMRDIFLLVAIYVILVIAHWSLLTLPYFWDEAGYYIPAAYDFFNTGTLIPASTISNAHPPLPFFYLAIWWKIFGFAQFTTRAAMLLVAAFALLETWKLAKLFCFGSTYTRLLPIAVTSLLACFPIFFAQSSMAHADLSAMALTLFGLRLWLEKKRAASSFAFALACLAKETAIIFPLAIILWEFLPARLTLRLTLVHDHGADGSSPSRFLRALPLAMSTVPLIFWYTYHVTATGHIFGNAEFLRYNLTDTLNPLRFIAAFLQRGWHLFGHMNLWVLTLAAITARLVWPAPAKKSDTGVSVAAEMEHAGAQRLFIYLILIQWVFYSLAGGALLTRYLLVAYPLILLLFMHSLAQRTTQWQWVSLLIAGSFLYALWNSPPYRSAPEDNLAYRDAVLLHQGAIGYIAEHYKDPIILTAWPASDEVTRPWLGYSPQDYSLAKHPPRIVRIEDFSPLQILAARQNSDYNVALVFSTKDIPERRIRFTWWEKLNQRFFQDHDDLAPDAIAKILGGKVMYHNESTRGWVAVIYIERSELARLTLPTTALPATALPGTGVTLY